MQARLRGTLAGQALTPREYSILALLAGGTRATKAIAEKLGLSHWTVQSHRKVIYAKLGICGGSVDDLVAVAERLGCDVRKPLPALDRIERAVVQSAPAIAALIAQEIAAGVHDK